MLYDWRLGPLRTIEELIMTSNIARAFILVGALFAVLGMLMGIGMGMSEDFTYAPVHAHINLVGWASMALFGLAYRAGLARLDRLAVVHFWVALAGGIVLAIGIYLSMAMRQPAVAIIGSLLTLASMIIFVINVVRARA
jgi:hypothetical protein